VFTLPISVHLWCLWLWFIRLCSFFAYYIFDLRFSCWRTFKSRSSGLWHCVVMSILPHHYTVTSQSTCNFIFPEHRKNMNIIWFGVWFLS
jgi:hypothetical protein